MKLSVIICTKDRENELLRCLKSIKKQTRLPDEIIIVDDGNLNISRIEKSNLSYRYIKKKIPGVAASRNFGVRCANGDIISFLDDDVVLFKNYFEEIIKFFKKNKNVAGVDGLIINRPKYGEFSNFIKRVFLIISKKQGKILPSGFYTEISDLRSPRKVDLLSGCATFKKEVFKKFKFDESFYKRWSLGEDKDFSYRVGKHYLLYVVPSAKLYHFKSKKTRPNPFDLGVMQVAHKIRFYMNYINKSFVTSFCFLWAMFGLISINFFNGLFFRQSINLFFGNVFGVFSYLFKRI